MASIPNFQKTLYVAAIATATVISAAAAVKAQDAALCARLAAQLHDYIGDRPASSNFQRYQMAVEDQLQLIERTNADMLRMGCSSGSVIVYGGSEQSDCRRLAADMRRMESDLRLFERKRNAHAARSGTTARQRVMDALRANECDVPGGVRIRQSLGVSGDDMLFDLDNPNARYRTLCVRTCDGYYFPISYSSSPMDFESDAARCDSMCPGTDVQLYFHMVPDQDSEDMVSVADQMPYTSLPNAFSYRDRKVGAAPQCICDQRYPPTQTHAKSEPESSIVTLKSAEASPDSGVASEQTPDIRNNEAKSDLDQPLARDLDPDRRVRVVGPMFLPDQSEAIDLQAPVPSERP
jgi:hypothetical protein